MNKVLFIGKVWPESGSSAAGVRILQLMELFLSKSYSVHFASAASKSEFSTDLRLLKVSTHSIELNNSSFDIFIKELAPDIVVFDRFTSEEQFGWRVSECVPNALRILDTEDLHALRTIRQKAFEEERDIKEADYHSEIFLRELASIYRCDLSLIISEYEMELLHKYLKVPSSLLYYLPLFVHVEEPSTNPGFNERKHFVSIGNFLHAPNLDSVLWMKKSIWPLIRSSLPQAELHIYGAYPPPQVLALHDPSGGFLVKGRTLQLKQVLQPSRVCLAPLRFGAGLKGKLLDAMRYGLPSITTSVGAEGMMYEDKWNGIVSEGVNAIADAAVKLYEDKELWDQCVQNGQLILDKKFRLSLFEESFYDKLKSLQKNVRSHRLKNLTGSIIQQQSLKSSKYMALWIEAKNKKEND